MAKADSTTWCRDRVALLLLLFYVRKVTGSNLPGAVRCYFRCAKLRLRASRLKSRIAVISIGSIAFKGNTWTFSCYQTNNQAFGRFGITNMSFRVLIFLQGFIAPVNLLTSCYMQIAVLVYAIKLIFHSISCLDALMPWLSLDGYNSTHLIELFWFPFSHVFRDSIGLIQVAYVISIQLMQSVYGIQAQIIVRRTWIAAKTFLVKAVWTCSGQSNTAYFHFSDS